MSIYHFHKPCWGDDGCGYLYRSVRAAAPGRGTRASAAGDAPRPFCS